MPRQFVNELIPRVDFSWPTIKANGLPFLLIVSFVIGLYAASQLIAAGWVTYALCAGSAFLCGLTALARINSIKHSDVSPRWHVRRLGLILAMSMCVSYIIGPLLAHMLGKSAWPSWREATFFLSVWLIWLTTPNMPPWHRFISGNFKTLDVQVPDDVLVEVSRGAPGDTAYGRRAGDKT